MSIVDVGFIQDHCDQDASIILVDSSARDTHTFPSPAEYTIGFNEPIKLVYGLTILDAMIPNALFNNDLHNNLLCMSHIHMMKNTDAQNMMEYTFAHMEGNAEFKKILDYKETEKATIRSENMAYNIVLLNGALYDDHIAPYILTYIDPLIDVPLKNMFSFFIRRKINSITHSQVRLVTNTDAKNDKTNTFMYFNSGRNNYYKVMMTLISPSLMKYFTKGVVYVDDTDPTNLKVYFHDIVLANNVEGASATTRMLGFNNLSDNEDYKLRYGGPVSPIIMTDFVWLEMLNLYIPAGNYEFGNSSVASLNYCASIKTAHDTLQSQIYGDIIAAEIQLNKKIKFTSTMPFLFFINKSTCGRCIGMFHPVKNPFEYTILTYEKDNTIFMSLQKNAAQESHTLLPDGIVNLTSIPYIVLKFKELEENIHRSYPAGKSGFGVFKLGGNVNDVAHLRFDFTNFVKRPFHPISKLTKLTVRFETPSGELYDFKGVDHMFILSVNYYVAKSDVNMHKQSVLNPNYNPNFVMYMQEYHEKMKRSEDVLAKRRILPNLDEYIKLNRENEHSSSDDTSSSEESI